MELPVLLGSLLSCLLVSAAVAECPGERPTKHLVCYVDNVPQQFDPCLCTHLVINTPLDKLSPQHEVVVAARRLREHNPELRLVARLTEGAEALRRRDALAHTVAGVVHKLGLDGVEVDLTWGKEGAAKLQLVNFVQTLSQELAQEDSRGRTKRSYKTQEEIADDVVTPRWTPQANSRTNRRKTRDADDKSTSTTEETRVTTDKEEREEEEKVENEEEEKAADTASERASQQEIEEEEEVPTEGKLIILHLASEPQHLAKNFDLKRLSKYVSFFTVATDNLTDSTESGLAYHPSRLMGIDDILNADSLVDLVTGLGAPHDKLVLTIPATALRFTLQDRNKNMAQSPVTGPPTRVSRAELCKLMSQGEWTVERDEDLTAPYAFHNDTWLAFDDPTSVSIKGKYVILRDLGGAAVTSADSDDWSGNCNSSARALLLTTLHDTFTHIARKSRAAQLVDLQEQLHSTGQFSYSGDIHLSPYRIVRVVDRAGAIHVVRKEAKTEFECSRQGYFRHPSGCNRFYRCVKFNQYSPDFTVFEYDCPAGLAFDETVEVCVWPGSLADGGACQGSSEIAPVPRQRYVCPSSPGYYADPENCRWFFACLDHHGDGSPLTAYEFRCPFGLVFDEQALVCNWPWLVPGCGGSGVYSARFTVGDFFEGRHRPSYASVSDYHVSGGRIDNVPGGVVLGSALSGIGSGAYIGSYASGSNILGTGSAGAYDGSSGTDDLRFGSYNIGGLGSSLPAGSLASGSYQSNSVSGSAYTEAANKYASGTGSGYVAGSAAGVESSYSGAGGSSYSGAGGSSHSGTGGSSYSGAGGSSYSGAGGSSYNGAGGSSYSGAGGSSYSGAGGSSYSGAGGSSYSGAGGISYSGAGGSSYNGAGGSSYNGAGGISYSGVGGSSYNGAGGSSYNGVGGSSYSGEGGNIYRGAGAYATGSGAGKYSASYSGGLETGHTAQSYSSSSKYGGASAYGGIYGGGSYYDQSGAYIEDNSGAYIHDNSGDYIHDGAGDSGGLYTGKESYGGGYIAGVYDNGEYRGSYSSGGQYKGSYVEGGKYSGSYDTGIYNGEGSSGGKYKGDYDSGSYSGNYDKGSYTGKYDTSDYSGKYDGGSYSDKYDTSGYSGKFDSASYSGKYDVGAYSGKYDAGSYSGKYDASTYSGKYDGGAYSGKYDAGAYSGKYDAGAYSGKYEGGLYSGGSDLQDYHGGNHYSGGSSSYPGGYKIHSAPATIGASEESHEYNILNIAEHKPAIELVGLDAVKVSGGDHAEGYVSSYITQAPVSLNSYSTATPVSTYKPSTVQPTTPRPLTYFPVQSSPVTPVTTKPLISYSTVKPPAYVGSYEQPSYVKTVTPASPAISYPIPTIGVAKTPVVPLNPVTYTYKQPIVKNEYISTEFQHSAPAPGVSYEQPSYIKPVTPAPYYQKELVEYGYKKPIPPAYLPPLPSYSYEYKPVTYVKPAVLKTPIVPLNTIQYSTPAPIAPLKPISYGTQAPVAYPSYPKPVPFSFSGPTYLPPVEPIKPITYTTPAPPVSFEYASPAIKYTPTVLKTPVVPLNPVQYSTPAPVRFEYSTPSPVKTYSYSTSAPAVSYTPAVIKPLKPVTYKTPSPSASYEYPTPRPIQPVRPLKPISYSTPSPFIQYNVPTVLKTPVVPLNPIQYTTTAPQYEYKYSTPTVPVSYEKTLKPVEPAVTYYSTPAPPPAKPAVTYYSTPAPPPAKPAVTYYSTPAPPPAQPAVTYYSTPAPPPAQPAVTYYSTPAPPPAKPAVTYYSTPEPPPAKPAVTYYSTPAPPPAKPAVTYYSTPAPPPAQPAVTYYSTPAPPPAKPAVTYYSTPAPPPAQPAVTYYSTPAPPRENPIQPVNVKPLSPVKYSIPAPVVSYEYSRPTVTPTVFKTPIVPLNPIQYSTPAPVQFQYSTPSPIKTKTYTASVPQVSYEYAPQGTLEEVKPLKPYSPPKYLPPEPVKPLKPISYTTAAPAVTYEYSSVVKPVVPSVLKTPVVPLNPIQYTTPAPIYFEQSTPAPYKPTVYSQPAPAVSYEYAPAAPLKPLKPVTYEYSPPVPVKPITLSSPAPFSYNFKYQPQIPAVLKAPKIPLNPIQYTTPAPPTVVYSTPAPPTVSYEFSTPTPPAVTYGYKPTSYVKPVPTVLKTPVVPLNPVQYTTQSPVVNQYRFEVAYETPDIQYEPEVTYKQDYVKTKVIKEGYNYPKPAVRFEEVPKVISTTPAPSATYTYETPETTPVYKQIYNYVKSPVVSAYEKVLNAISYSTTPAPPLLPAQPVTPSPVSYAPVSVGPSYSRPPLVKTQSIPVTPVAVVPEYQKVLNVVKATTTPSPLYVNHYENTYEPEITLVSTPKPVVYKKKPTTVTETSYVKDYSYDENIEEIYDAVRSDFGTKLSGGYEEGKFYNQQKVEIPEIKFYTSSTPAPVPVIKESYQVRKPVKTVVKTYEQPSVTVGYEEGSSYSTTGAPAVGYEEGSSYSTTGAPAVVSSSEAVFGEQYHKETSYSGYTGIEGDSIKYEELDQAIPVAPVYTSTVKPPTVKVTTARVSLPVVTSTRPEGGYYVRKQKVRVRPVVTTENYPQVYSSTYTPSTVSTTTSAPTYSYSTTPANFVTSSSTVHPDDVVDIEEEEEDGVKILEGFNRQYGGVVNKGYVSSTVASIEDGEPVVGILKKGRITYDGRRTKTKVVVVSKLSDFNPLLVGKLGAECSCDGRSNTVTVRRHKQRGSNKLFTPSISDQQYVDTYQTSTTTAAPIVVKSESSYESAAFDSSSYDSPVVEIKPIRKKTRFYSTTTSPPEVSEEDVSAANFVTAGADRVKDRIECKRAGLFRHPKKCNKFYSCDWDQWKKKFTVNEFKCPIHLAYDANLGACNWPSKGPACAEDSLLV